MIDMFLHFFSFFENCGTNLIFVYYCLLPIVVIPFHLITANTYTRLYQVVQYQLPNQLLGFNFQIKRKKICNESYDVWLRHHHSIPRRYKTTTTTTTTITTKPTFITSYSCRHQSSNYSRDYMFNIHFLAYFSSLYHAFPSHKPISIWKPNNTTTTSGRPATYTPFHNPKHPNFHYYNKKKHNIGSYFNKHNKHNNKQNVSLIPNLGPVHNWYRKYHPISTLCADYDKFIFQSIQYWSLTHTTTSIEAFDASSISSFIDSFDVLKHYTSPQNLHTATIPPHYKSQPTTSPLYKQILLEARDL